MALRHKLSLWLPPLAVMAAIFWLSHRPLLVEPIGGDKLAHLVAYTVLALAWARCLAGDRRLQGYGFFWAAALIAATYGVSDEWHQSFVEGRHASVEDVVADTAGSWLGAALWLLWSKSPKAK